MAVNKKKPKWYYYAIKDTCEGDEKVRNISSKSDPLDYDEIFRSRIKPQDRKEAQEYYDQFGPLGEQGDFGHSEYADLIRAAQKGGQNSSRRKWKNEAEKQRAKRVRTKVLRGEELTAEEQELVNRGNPSDKSAEVLTQLTNPRYRYHLDRAATAKERKSRWKEKVK